MIVRDTRLHTTTSRRRASGGNTRRLLLPALALVAAAALFVQVPHIAQAAEPAEIAAAVRDGAAGAGAAPGNAAPPVETAPPASATEPAVPEPQDYRTEAYRAPVPMTLAGARVVDTDAAEALWTSGAIFIDVYPQAPKPPNLPASTVWRTPKHESIKGATWLANVGYGVLNPVFEAYFRAGMERLTGGDKDKTLVFFCLRDCWMSWNAAKRALSWGHTSVVWFPDGTDGWKELGLPTEQLTPAE